MPQYSAIEVATNYYRQCDDLVAEIYIQKGERNWRRTLDDISQPTPMQILLRHAGKTGALLVACKATVGKQASDHAVNAKREDPRLPRRSTSMLRRCTNSDN